MGIAIPSPMLGWRLDHGPAAVAGTRGLIRTELRQGSDWVVDDLDGREGEAVLAAAEGGDRVLRLLSARPKRIAVVDRNPAQLHLLQLKLAALKSLAHADYLELMGPRPSRRRRALFQRLRWLLPKESDEFWLARLPLIDRGVAQQGEFERQLSSFRQFVRLVHGTKKVERFQALATEEERRRLYTKEWQTALWRHFGARIWKRWFEVGPDRLERLLFEGRLLAPPPQLTAAEFESAKELANRVLIVNELPQDYLRAQPGDSVDLFLLGRMDLRGLEAELCHVARPGARMSYVAGSPDERPPVGFVAQGVPREAGFFPGHLISAVLPA
jgi:S-adenosylmethionine:diacylglycerol 3-amino-3-carboxypropyl transferase